MDIVLFIDDDRSFLDVVEAQLSGNSFRVFTSTSGSEGLKTASSLNPDLIICDIHMPGMDGFEVLKNLRRDTITKTIPVIMLTGITHKEALYKAMRYNIVDYIIKPYKPDLLIKKMHAAIHYNKLKKEREISDESEHLLISRDTDSVIISFNTPLKSTGLISEIKNVFSSFFLRSLADKKCIIDLRSLDEMGPDDTKVLGLVIKLFGTRELLIIAGRHYGEIVASPKLDDIIFGETTHLFISYGDMEIFLQKKAG